MPRPDYKGGSIVNLMASIVAGIGGNDVPLEEDAARYPPHPDLAETLIEGSRHVILLVIDGLGYDYLCRLSPNGALSAGLKPAMTSVFPSTTTSAITTFLTADAPQQHAMTGWYMWFREAGMVASPLPYRTRAGNRLLGTCGIHSKTLFDRRPLLSRIERQCFMVQPAQLAESAYTRAHVGNATMRSYHTLKQMFTCIRKISDGRNLSFTYAYWPELDSLGHRHGMESNAAVVHLKEIEEGVAALLDSMRGQGATLIVTADHGFVDSDAHSWVELEDHPELAETLVAPLCGEPRAAYCYVNAHRQQDFEDYVRERLGEQCELHSSQELIAGNYFGHGAPHPRLAERIGHYCLIMKGNHAIRDRLVTEKHGKIMIGVHGGTSSAEMRVPLALFPA